jgi:hypothetical protein
VGMMMVVVPLSIAFLTSVVVRSSRNTVLGGSANAKEVVRPIKYVAAVSLIMFSPIMIIELFMRLADYRAW